MRAEGPSSDARTDRGNPSCYLGIETSSETGGAALLEGDRLVGEIRWRLSGDYEERLLPAIHDLLRAASLPPSGIAAIGAGRGPGSFTGIRIGLAAAQGLSAGTGRPAFGVSSLECLARGVPIEGARRIVALLDARRGCLYTAAFEPEPPGSPFPVRRVAEDRLEPVGDVLEYLREEGSAGGPVVVAGSGAERFAKEIREALPGALVLPGRLAFPSATEAARVAREMHGGARPAGPASPAYLRPADARRRR